MTAATSKISFERVSIVFGAAPEKALPLMDEGRSREEIDAATGQVLGVHDCSLEVGEGEIVVLMGLSGSGKSTLLRAINGLNPVVRGAVTVRDGGWSCDPARCSPGDLLKLRRACVSMVFQQFGLLPWRTVIENVAFGLEIGGVAKAERMARAREQLRLVNLDAWADRRVQELSGGMQQRVGLARAFATDAPILLMDEPFSALDPLIRNRLQDELLELQTRLKRTIVFVSHDLDEALKLGSRIAIMEGGRIVQIGTPREIVLAPATDYVADFVAHMNPLNVLSAGDCLEVGRARASSAIDESRPVMPVATPVRDIMAALARDPTPVQIVEDGHVVGLLGEGDILRALLDANRGHRT